MDRRFGRFGVLFASFALILSACSSSTGSPAASADAASAAPSASAAAEASASAEASADSATPSATPVPTPLPANTSTAKPGDIDVRWFCCLGTGDSPDQVVVEQKVADDFNASHPGIHLGFEGYVYAAARDGLAVQIGAGNAPCIVGPIGIGGANSFHNQWLDLQPLIDKNHYDMTQYPKSTVELYNVGGEGQVGIPYAIYPSVLWYKSGLFKEAGLNEPPHTFNSKYTMPDGSVVPWDYDTDPEAGPAPDGRQERQGRDRGRLRSDQRGPVGLRAAAR